MLVSIKEERERERSVQRVCKTSKNNNKQTNKQCLNLSRPLCLHALDIFNSFFILHQVPPSLFRLLNPNTTITTVIIILISRLEVTAETRLKENANQDMPAIRTRSRSNRMHVNCFPSSWRHVTSVGGWGGWE